jgi:hypothetical protein
MISAIWTLDPPSREQRHAPPGVPVDMAARTASGISAERSSDSRERITIDWETCETLSPLRGGTTGRTIEETISYPRNSANARNVRFGALTRLDASDTGH